MPGRKPTPTNLRVLRGNPGKRAIPNEPSAPSGGKAPDWLDIAARPFWEHLYDRATQMRVMTVADEYGLAMLAEAMAEYKFSDKISHRSEARRFAKSMLSEFGLTPSSRSRLKASEAEEGEDKWAGLLS